MKPSEKEVLLTFVTQKEDGSNKINIYGTPAGLRKLAKALVKQADVDQSEMKHLGDYDTDHTHLNANFEGSMLSNSSDEVQLGRVDLRTGELAYWAKEKMGLTGDTPDLD